MKQYRVNKAVKTPALAGAWHGDEWSIAETAAVDQFRRESSAHRPAVSVKLLYSDDGLHGIFRAEDRYVRCVRTKYMDSVCKDSCVEFFVKPDAGPGYFNFEFNCGGCLFSSYIEDHCRAPQGFVKWTPLPEEDARRIRIFHSMPAVVDPEIDGPVEWTLEFFIPFGVMQERAGKFSANRGAKWRGNFYKCGDDTSHPHWAAWSPVPELNFHEPAAFGELVFG